MLRRLGRLGYGMNCGGQEGGISPYLDGILDSVVFDLDATVSGSYAGTGATWSNLASSPADGETQTGYDFYLGDGATSAKYPTFNGTAGDAGAYWSFDGDDWFQLKSGSNPDFINDLGKTTGGSDFWMAITGQTQTTAGSGLISTKDGNVDGIDILAYNSANTRMAYRQRGGSEAGLYPTNQFAAGSAFVVIWTHSHSTNKSRYYYNTTSATEQNHTFNTNTATPDLLTIGALGPSGTLPLPSGWRIYSAAMGNEYIGDTEAAAIIDHLETRHGRDYTP